MEILNSVVFPWKIIQPQDVSSAWELKAYESYALHYPVIFRDYSLWHQTCLLSWMNVIFHHPLEDSLIQPFPAGSWPLPFPRTLGKFRIGPHLAGEWTGKVKLEAVLYWEYSVYRKEWWVTDSCLMAHSVKVVLLYLKALLRNCAWQSFSLIPGIKVRTLLEGIADEAKLA